MTVLVDLQLACENSHIPSRKDIETWLNAALDNIRHEVEVTVRVVNEHDSGELNERWRQASGPTNVLSFPADSDTRISPELLGDIVICATVIEKEALQQNKPVKSHWAHIVVHGALHLLGYDHVQDNDAEKMEALEIDILEKLGIDNPYNC